MPHAIQNTADGTEEGGDAPHSLRVERRIALLASLGLTRDRILGQLLHSGFASEELKPHFTEFPDAAFVQASRPTARVVRQPTLSAPAAPTPAPASLRALKLPSPLLTTKSAAPTRLGDSASATLDGISFHYVPLIQCSFPHADPGEASSFTRRNGWLELTLGTTRPEAGLPYGVPSRLLTIYCASEAVRTRSPEIYLGKSVHDFLHRLDVPITRGARGSLSVYANQLLRLVHSTLSIDENIRDATGRVGLHIRQALFVEEAKLWWDERDGVGQGSSLVLSSVLFNSILERSAPLSTKAIRQLRKSPMDLDVYAWLAHRLFHLTKPSTMTWAQLSSQFGHGYHLIRKFRHHFADSVNRVLAVYPEACLKLADVGVILFPSKPHVPRDSIIKSKA